MTMQNTTFRPSQPAPPPFMTTGPGSIPEFFSPTGGGGSPAAGNDFFGDLFEQDPLGRRALFQSLLPKNADPFQTQLFGQLFEPTFNQFLGQLGAQVRGGGAPSMSFTDFLNNQFDPQRALLRLPQSGQGQGTGGTIFNFG